MIRETERYLGKHLDDQDVSWPRREDRADVKDSIRQHAAERHSDPSAQVERGREATDPAILVKIGPQLPGQSRYEWLMAIRGQLWPARKDDQKRDVVIDLSQVPSLNGLLVWMFVCFAWRLQAERRDVALFGVDKAWSQAIVLRLFPGLIYYRLKPGEALYFDDEDSASPVYLTRTQEMIPVSDSVVSTVELAR